MMNREYKLEVAPAPSKEHTGVYDAIVREFIATVLDNPAVSTKSARVTLHGRQAKTVQIGLLKAAHSTGRKGIMVSIRGGEVWLLKK